MRQDLFSTFGPLISHCPSLLAIEVVWYVDGVCVEDQIWLQPFENGSHIFLAVSWKMKCFRVVIDSSGVFNWVKSIIGRDCKFKGRGSSEVLVHRD